MKKITTEQKKGMGANCAFLANKINEIMDHVQTPGKPSEERTYGYKGVTESEVRADERDSIRTKLMGVKIHFLQDKGAGYIKYTDVLDLLK